MDLTLNFSPYVQLQVIQTAPYSYMHDVSFHPVSSLLALHLGFSPSEEPEENVFGCRSRGS